MGRTFTFTISTTSKKIALLWLDEKSNILSWHHITKIMDSIREELYVYVVRLALLLLDFYFREGRYELVMKDERVYLFDWLIDEYYLVFIIPVVIYLNLNIRIGIHFRSERDLVFI